MAKPTRPSVLEDARTIAAADPAGQGTVATLLSYPGLHAVDAHRLWSTRWGKPAAQATATAAAKATGSTIYPAAMGSRHRRASRCQMNT